MRPNVKASLVNTGDIPVDGRQQRWKILHCSFGCVHFSFLCWASKATTTQYFISVQMFFCMDFHFKKIK